VGRRSSGPSGIGWTFLAGAVLFVAIALVSMVSVPQSIDHRCGGVSTTGPDGSIMCSGGIPHTRMTP
jgi:hypothetical protein